MEVGSSLLEKLIYWGPYSEGLPPPGGNFGKHLKGGEQVRTSGAQNQELGERPF